MLLCCGAWITPFSVCSKNCVRRKFSRQYFLHAFLHTLLRASSLVPAHHRMISWQINEENMNQLLCFQIMLSGMLFFLKIDLFVSNLCDKSTKEKLFCRKEDHHWLDKLEWGISVFNLFPQISGQLGRSLYPTVLEPMNNGFGDIGIHNRSGTRLFQPTD